jgi:hypothetical protein
LPALRLPACRAAMPMLASIPLPTLPPPLSSPARIRGIDDGRSSDRDSRLCTCPCSGDGTCARVGSELNMRDMDCGLGVDTRWPSSGGSVEAPLWMRRGDGTRGAVLVSTGGGRGAKRGDELVLDGNDSAVEPYDESLLEPSTVSSVSICR